MRIRFTFFTSKGAVTVRYRDVNMLEYGQRVSRRYLEAIFISPVFLMAKRRRCISSRSATPLRMGNRKS